MRILKINLTLLFILLLNSVLLTINAQELPYNEDVHIGYLENGLKYYIHPNNKPTQKLELRLVVAAGSMQEEEHQRGLAHFTEHMMFNGTKSYPKNTLVDKLETMGIAFGADLNAYTSFDETVYILPIPTQNKEYVEEGFKILKEWAGDALMLNEDIDEERTIIIEESRLSKSADRRMYEKFFPKLFNNNLYAHRLPIGKDSVILYAPYDAFRSFYKEWYRPNLMAVVAVGDITKEEAERLIKKYFGELKPNPLGREKAKINAEPYAKNEVMIITDKEAVRYNASIYFSPKPQLDQATVQAYRENILQTIWVGALNKRLRALTEQEQPPFTAAAVTISGYMKGYESFIINIVPSDNMSNAVQAVITEVNRMKQHGITEEEISLAKKNMLASAENSVREKGTISSDYLVEAYVRNFLDRSTIEGPEYRLKYYQELLPTINVEELNKNITKWIDNNETFFATVTGPENGKIALPSDKQMLNLIEQTFKKTEDAYVAKATKDGLVDVESLILNAGKIEKEVKDVELETIYYTLSNGIKVAYKPTKFKNDEIVFEASNYGGTMQYNTMENNYKEQTFFVSSFLDLLGYGEFLPTDLQNYMVGKMASVNLSMSDVENKISGASTVKDFETMLQLLHLKLTSLRKDVVMLNSVKSMYKPQFAMLNQNPQYAFLDTLNKTLYNNSPLAPIVLPTEAMMDALDIDKIYKIYEEQFKNAAAGFFYAFTGNVPEDQFKEMISIYLGSLPPVSNNTKWVDNGLRPVQGYQELNFHAGVDDKALILQIVHGKLEYSQALHLKASMLMEVLNFKVIEEIREKLGAIYGGGFNIEVSKEPYPYYNITLQLPCAPDNVDKILAAMSVEIDKIKKEGVSQKDLDKVVANYLESNRTALESNSSWANKIVNIERWEHDKNRFLNYKEVISEVSTNDLKATANLLFGGVNSNIFQAVLYPETYKK